MSRDVCEHFNPVDLPCDKCKPASVQKNTLREAALTPWFHPTETPERIGVYQRIRWAEDDPFYSYWDGRLWWPSGVTVDEAHVRYAAYLPYGVPRWVSQLLQWRGVSRA